MDPQHAAQSPVDLPGGSGELHDETSDSGAPRWKLLDLALMDGESEVALWEREGLFVIMVDDGALMASRAHGSEEAMARYGCQRLRNAASPRVLVGGLGLGYTLAATLRRLPPSAQVVVAERVPSVVEWNRGVLAPLAGHPLDDPRVEVQVADVAEVLHRDRASYDAILLDVDNGPYSLSLIGNDELYSWTGVTTSLRALRPDGTLVVWSATPDPQFQAQLQRMGLTFRTHTVGARGGKRGEKHFLHIVRA